MFRTILTATDGSDHATKAIGLASDLAVKYDARLVLLHVLLRDNFPEGLRHMVEVEHLAGETPSQRARLADVPQAMVAAPGTSAAATPFAVIEAAGRVILDRAGKIARKAGVKEVHTRIEDGDPAKTILDIAAREGADLIVLGTRGLGDLQGLLMGSVSHKVSHHSTCTCVTVK